MVLGGVEVVAEVENVGVVQEMEALIARKFVVLVLELALVG